MSIELVDVKNGNDNFLIDSPLLSGEHLVRIRSFIETDSGSTVFNGVFSNAMRATNFFIDPQKTTGNESSHLSKILAIGKVQSGKTSFFITSIALAFDNGYDIALVIGGTKNTLKQQNFSRITEYFKNNNDVVVYDINKVTVDDIYSKRSSGYKIILISLKNASGNKNLGCFIKNMDFYKSIPIFVVDDEGDEVTPGAPKKAEKTGRNGLNHEVISKIIYGLCCCTYLSVTATPQANFLISTFDLISPDYCLLVEPGASYTGGNCFHDSEDNPHIVETLDTDDFKDSVPSTFIDALNFFLFSCCLKRSKKIFSPFSMLVHPSSLNKIQTSVVEKIKDQINLLKKIILDELNVSYYDAVIKIYNQVEEYKKINPYTDINITIQDIKSEICKVVESLDIFEFNITKSGKFDIQRESESEKLYKIYVGGNMLGRGLTIKNLSTTYIYRDSNAPAIDSLYQRARWLGYKSEYFDICRVYMTDSLKQQFMTVVDSENEMRSDISTFLNSNINIKKMPRIFALNDDTGKLILTRTSISHTIKYSVINKGFQYDRSCQLSKEFKEKNYKLYCEYFNKYKKLGEEKCFDEASKDKHQTHFIIKTSFKSFYEEFLKNYIYPKNSKFNNVVFEKIIENINNGIHDDELYVIVMRYKTGQYRSIEGTVGYKVKELINSYSNSGKYSGDKDLEFYKDKQHFQIHLVYTDEMQPEKMFPLLAFNNPMSKKLIKYVTGDNIYETEL